MEHLSLLTFLNLSDTQIDDAALVHLASLTSLQNLNLKKTRITDQGLRNLMGLRYLPDLYSVNLAETGVTMSGLLCLPERPLLFVDLSLEQITKQEFSELQQRRPNWVITIDDLLPFSDYDQAVTSKADNYGVEGWLKLQEGDLDGAIIDYRKALSVKPDHVGAHNGLGSVLKEKGDLDGAIREYCEAIRIDPKWSDPYYNLGIALRRVGRHAEAVWAIKEFLQLCKNVPSNRVWIDRARTILVELEKER
jgi:tetratricopeptide (TPR) repeat protein